MAKARGTASRLPRPRRHRNANHQLRQSLVFLNVPALPHEAYIGNAAKLFDDKGTLIADETREFLNKFLQRFENWIDRNAAPRP